MTSKRPDDIVALLREELEQARLPESTKERIRQAVDREGLAAARLQTDDAHEAQSRVAPTKPGPSSLAERLTRLLRRPALALAALAALVLLVYALLSVLVGEEPTDDSPERLASPTDGGDDVGDDAPQVTPQAEADRVTPGGLTAAILPEVASDAVAVFRRRGEIWAVRPGGDPLRLTNLKPAARVSSIAASRDGLIAYYERREGLDNRIVTMDLGGSSSSVLVANAGGPHERVVLCELDPTGSRLLYLEDVEGSREGDMALREVTLDGQVRTVDNARVADRPDHQTCGTYDPRLPDRVVFASTPRGRGHLTRLFEVVGGAPRQPLGAIEAPSLLPVFGPDGEEFAFLDRRHAVTAVSIASRDGTVTRTVAFTGEPADRLRWTPDGHYISFEQAGDVMVIPSNASQPRQPIVFLWAAADAHWAVAPRVVAERTPPLRDVDLVELDSRIELPVALWDEWSGVGDASRWSVWRPVDRTPLGTRSELIEALGEEAAMTLEDRDDVLALDATEGSNYRLTRLTTVDISSIGAEPLEMSWDWAVTDLDGHASASITFAFYDTDVVGEPISEDALGVIRYQRTGPEVPPCRSASTHYCVDVAGEPSGGFNHHRVDYRSIAHQLPAMRPEEAKTLVISITSYNDAGTGPLLLIDNVEVAGLPIS